MRDSITLTVHYDTPIDLSGSMVIGLSQSGQTPDVVEYVAASPEGGCVHRRDHERRRLRPRRRGRGDDPARRRAGARRRGDEDVRQHARRARAARGPHRRPRSGDRGRDPRRRRSSCRSSLPEFEAATRSLALPFAYTGRMFVIGRGTEFATAREIALKLLETCRIAAEPLTATDLAHGPVAALDPFFPVWAIASADGTLATVQEAAARIHAMGATLVASGTAATAVTVSSYRLPVPADRAGAALAAALGRPGSAVRAGALPRPRPRPGRAARPQQGHARHLAAAARSSTPRAAPRAGARSTRSPRGRRPARCRRGR